VVLKQKVGCFLLGILMPMVASTSVSDLDAKQQHDLAAGKVVIQKLKHENEHMHALNGYMLVQTPPAALLKAVTDFSELPKYTPNLERIDVLESSANSALVNFELALPFGVKKRYRLFLNYGQADKEFGQGAEQMTWLIQPWPELEPEETIKFTSGYWLMRPTAKKNETHLTYHTETDPGEVPFGLGWIVEYLTNKTVVELLSNTRERAEQQWQALPTH